MSDTAHTALTIIGSIVALWLIISASGALPLLMLAKVDLAKLSDEQASSWLAKVFTTGFFDSHWLDDRGFQPVGVYQVKGQIANPHLVVWKRGNERTYVCSYLLFGAAGPADILTFFDKGGLTTGTSKDGLLVPPRPDRWMQAFKVADAKEQWKHHEEGLQFLFQAIGQRPSVQDIEFYHEFVNSVRAHTAYVRSLPLWYLRIPYWYVARRFGLFGKSAREQFERKHGRAVQP